MPRTVDLRKKVQKEKVSFVSKEPLIEEGLDMVAKTTKKIEWEAPSFYYNPQKKYLALILIGLLCGSGALFLFYQDTLMAIFLMLSSLVLILYANKKPTLSKIIINQAGIKVDDYHYYYKELKSFWLDYTPHGLKELSLEAKKWYTPYIKISIENQSPIEIRSLMINYITEKEHQKSLIDLISRKIGL